MDQRGRRERESEARPAAPRASNLHLGALALGAGSTVLVALRLLSAAKYNPETAYGILQASGTADVLIGTVISLIPSIAIIVALYLTLRLIFPGLGKPNAGAEPDKNDPVSKPDKLNPGAEMALSAALVTVVLIALFTIPLRYSYYVGIIFLLFVVPVWILRKKIRGSWHGKTGRRAARAGGVLIALLLLAGVALSPPWMPAEQLTLNNGSHVTGYILAHDAGGVAILQLKPRQILYDDGPNALAKQVMCSNVPPDDFAITFFIPPVFRFLNLYRYPHC